MALYGDRHVEPTALKKWVKSLSTENLSAVDIGGTTVEVTSEIKDILDRQIKAFSSLVEMMKPGDDWRSLQGILSPLFYNAFFRLDNCSIQIANFYECLIIPSNIKTYKKIIKGFDYKECGAVQIYDGKTYIGEIGQKSDLLWCVFYEYFINEGIWGDVVHTHDNHEKYMSIQLYRIAGLPLEEIKRIVSEILLNVSVEHDLDFSIVDADPLYKSEGESKTYGIQFHGVQFEYIPSLYFNNASRVQDVRMAYLSYYQVLEYFFVREQNYYFLYEYSALSMTPLNHNELRKVLKKYKDSLSERESLKLVLKKCIDMPKFRGWMNQDSRRISQYCSPSSNAIDLSKPDEKIITKLCDRIYSLRCSIAHAKGDIEEYMAIPTISDTEVSKELELVKYIAYEALKRCSEV